MDGQRPVPVLPDSSCLVGGQPGPSGPEQGRSYPNKDSIFMIAKTFTRKNIGKVFVIMGIFRLASFGVLRAGLQERKRSGRWALGLPSETADDGHFAADGCRRSERAPLLADAPIVRTLQQPRQSSLRWV
jgi:hypothetical protein